MVATSAEPLSVLTAMLRLQMAVARFDREVRADGLAAEERLHLLERRWDGLDLSTIVYVLEAAARAADELREGRLV